MFWWVCFVHQFSESAPFPLKYQIPLALNHDNMSVATFTNGAGNSPLERLPAELLRKILIYVTLPDQSTSYVKCEYSLPTHITCHSNLTNFPIRSTRYQSTRKEAASEFVAMSSHLSDTAHSNIPSHVPPHHHRWTLYSPQISNTTAMPPSAWDPSPDTRSWAYIQDHPLLRSKDCESNT